MTVELEDKLSPDLNRATRHDPKGIVVEIRAAHFGKATGAAISPDGKWLVHVIDDGAHQSFDWQHIDGVRYPHVIEKECVGCNLCYLICPSPRRHQDETHRPAAHRSHGATAPPPISPDALISDEMASESLPPIPK